MLDEVAPGEGVDDNSPLADEIAAVDATTADITNAGEASATAAPATDGGMTESSSPGELSNVSSATESTESIESAPVDGEAEPERERDPFEEVDFGSTFEEYLDPGYKTHEYEAKDEVSFENMLTRRDSLCEQLIWQLHLTEITEEIRAAGEAIIGNLDENTGFLDATIEEIAAMGPWTVETVQQAAAVVQRLDPVGCAARDVRESLLVQLDYYGFGDRLAVQMVRSAYHSSGFSRKWKS